jgi:hypothetical protein
MSQSKPAHCIYMVIQKWIPAFAESTPRIGKKCSGGNDGGAGRTGSDDLAGLLACTTDDVIPVDQGDAGC